MNKIKNLISIVLILFCCIRCSKSEQQVNNDEYYVKYLFESTNRVGYNIYRNCNISFTSENGQAEMEFNTVNHLSYEVITGPFKYNSKIYATLDSGGFPNTSIQIFISKNDSPFVLKYITNEDRLEYIINY